MASEANWKWGGFLHQSLAPTTTPSSNPTHSNPIANQLNFWLNKKSCFNKVGYLSGILLYLQTVHEQKRWLQQTFRLHCLRQFPSRATDWQPFYMHNAKQCTELHFIVKQQLVHWHRGWSEVMCTCTCVFL